MILSLDRRPLFWNFRKYFSAQLYRQEVILHSLREIFQVGQMLSGRLGQPLVYLEFDLQLNLLF
jgi:hypothetical protein